MLIDHWPLCRLRVRTRRLELRLPTEDELAELADVAAQGVHRQGERPFLTPWTDGSAADRARHVLRYHWQRRGTWTPNDWALELVVFEHGRPRGVQELAAQDFATRREIHSSSWLGLEHHGRGIGTEMRSAVLHLAFAGLAATDATTGSFSHNAAPLRISRKLGYRPDGIDRDILSDRVVITQRLRLTRTEWEHTDRPPTTITGLAPCLAEFGATPSP